jgi:hypothetical protein
MAVYDFAHHRPGTLADACRLGVSLGAGTLYLAGGTELLPDFGRGLETGYVTVERFTDFSDAGTVVNPLTFHGQVEGAIANAIHDACGAATSSSSRRSSRSCSTVPPPRGARTGPSATARCSSSGC